MGMFDWVKYECICPVCHSKVDGFQSKSAERLLDALSPTDVDRFYSACNKCGCWIEFSRVESNTYQRMVYGKLIRDKIPFKRELLKEYTKDVKIG